MLRSTLVLLALTVAAVASAEEPKVTPLPSGWHGTWAGQMTVTGAADKTTEVPVVLRIEAIRGTDDLAWVMTYGDGEKKQVKDYKLVPVAGKPGRFRIDEQNGIVLDARLVNGVLYSQFEVGGRVLTARYGLGDDRIKFEVTSAKPAAEKTGDGKVLGYGVEAVQSAVLKKK
jgi:hypothetical protein